MSAANDPSFSASPPQHPVSPPSTSPAPPDSTAIQAGPPAPADEPSIALPPIAAPPRKQTTPEQLAAEIARLDRTVVAAVLALAFLLASFAVRNSDFWMHLATGRLIARGQYDFGVDPFTYTSTTYWANHAWLFDLILYGLASAAGGPESVTGGAVLVIAKALLITGLAWLLLKIRRPGQCLWAPAVCTALALLAMSPRFFLQPELVSMLFLGLTLYLLQRPGHCQPDTRTPGTVGRSPPAGYWLLVPLFVLWVNLNGWFLLGPFTVVLYLLGQWLQQLLAPVRTGEDAPEPHQQRSLLLVLLIGSAACLLNPHHYRAFTLPAQLPLPFAETPVPILEREESFQPLFYGLFQEEYLQSAVAHSIAGRAIWPLLVLAVASFVLSIFTGWRWWRFLIWMAFLVLGAYQVRTVPFLAVVAAPITALNLQDFVASRFGSVAQVDRLWKAWSLGGRIVTLLLLVALSLAAWPGWLHARLGRGFPNDAQLGHRVAWGVEPEPSLRNTAEQLAAWRSQGLLRPGDHGFNYSPDVVNYCAWFCPDEKGFFDYRFPLFSRDLAKAFVDVRRTLGGRPALFGDSAARPVDWPALFREHHINHVVMYGTNGMGLVQDWEQWQLLYLDGRTTIFRWHDPRDGAANLPQIPRLDLTRLAFGRNAERAPAASTERAPQQREFWVRFLHGPPLPPLDHEKAIHYLEYFMLMRGPWRFPALAATEVAAWSGAVALAAVNAGSVSAPATLALTSAPDLEAFGNVAALEFFLRDKSYGPAAAPLLAVRAARRAILASPDYADTYLTLAQAYSTLWIEQEEHWIGRSRVSQGFLPRRKLRQIQLLTALEYHLLLRPQSREAHGRLFQTYAEMQYWDLALDHLRSAVESVRFAGPARRESPKEFAKRLEQMGQELAKLDTDVKKRVDYFNLEAKDKELLVKVQTALRYGLAREARDLLLRADPAQLGPAEIDTLLNLLLSTGRPDQAREGLTETLKTSLGPDYEWYNTLIGAACGNYHQAAQFLEEFITRLDGSNTEEMLMRLRLQTFQGGMNPQSVYNLNAVLDRVGQVADYRVLRGLLALEEGDLPVAAKFFQTAKDMGMPEQLHFESRAIADRYLQLIQDAGGAP